MKLVWKIVLIYLMGCLVGYAVDILMAWQGRL